MVPLHVIPMNHATGRSAYGANGNPDIYFCLYWIPAFAGMTANGHEVITKVYL